MKRLLFAILIAVAAPLVSGCAMCCGTYDYAYPTYGGKWERCDREWGRVGSNLSGAGAAEFGCEALVGDAPYQDDIYIDGSSYETIDGGAEVPIYPFENGTVIGQQ